MSGATAHDPTTKQKMSIILYSGTVDKLTAAAILAAGGAAMDMQVNVFLTFWALLAMKKGAWQDTAQLKVSAEFAEYAPMMMEAVKDGKVKPWIEVLRCVWQDQNEENGHVRMRTIRGMHGDARRAR